MGKTAADSIAVNDRISYSIVGRQLLGYIFLGGISLASYYYCVQLLFSGEGGLVDVWPLFKSYFCISKNKYNGGTTCC